MTGGNNRMGIDSNMKACLLSDGMTKNIKYQNEMRKYEYKRGKEKTIAHLMYLM